MEVIGLLICMLYSFGLGFGSLKLVTGFKKYRRKRNKAYLKKIKYKKLTFYDNSDTELS